MGTNWGWWSGQRIHLAVTFGAVTCVFGFLIYFWSQPHPNPFFIAMSAGALGGIFHEFAQSGGTIAFYTVKSDGVYLGSLSGIVIGALAGLILFAGMSSQSDQVLLVQSILAGVGFKGVSEALGGKVGGSAPPPGN